MAEAATSLGSLMSSTSALRGKAAARYGAPTEPFGSLTTIHPPSWASGNLEWATRKTKRLIPSSQACLWASAITKFLLRRLFGRASEWKSPKSLPTRGSFHNLPPTMSPIMEASHVLPLRPVPKIHTSLSALSSAMTCIVADRPRKGKVPERRPRRLMNRDYRAFLGSIGSRLFRMSYANFLELRHGEVRVLGILRSSQPEIATWHT